MTLVPFNMSGEAEAAQETVLNALGEAPARASLTVMIHGLRFSPQAPGTDPHRHIFSFTPDPGCWKAVSWPRHLRIGREGGVGLALGWNAATGLGAAHRQARPVGEALAGLLDQIDAARPDLRINLIAHSLGARVALSAIAARRRARIESAILLSGAEYRAEAEAAMQRATTPAPRILNVTSGENLPFDLAFRGLVRPTRLGDWPLSAGLGRRMDAACDLRLDNPLHREGLRALGFRLPAPKTRYCHWSGYLRPGLFPLYRALFAPGGAALFAQLREVLAPQPRDGWTGWRVTEA